MQAVKVARILFAALIISGLFSFKKDPADSRMISYVADARNVRFYWKDNQGHILGSLQHLKDLEQYRKHTLVFAMNGGMYKEDQSPLGLYIENGRQLAPVNTVKASFGNFYMQPNGIFYITKGGVARICRTADYRQSANVQYATQSGPMLVINGNIHPSFKAGSKNLNIRNGVGILPDNKVVFAISRQEISFYDFAAYFKSLGCRNALYLDGFVSRMYLPEQQWIQTDGNFGVMIGVVKN